MTHPVYKIETYTSAILDHTIEKEVNSIYFKEVVTDAVGHFVFSVPTKKNGGYYYDDIALNDKIKIYLGYDSVGATPNFIGKVGKISAPLSIENGYIRLISGLSQGEILLRRFKKDKYYNAIGASTIVTEWANDLSLGTGEITADATAVTLEIRTKSYFELLRDISDYWASAEAQIKKDFYVDVGNNLIWKNRPLRTVGVEALTIGDNIINYDVTRDIGAIKNAITVYGRAEKPLPADKDAWTDSLNNWTAVQGTLELNENSKLGTYSIYGVADDGGFTSFRRSIPRITIRNINTLYFWHTLPLNPITAKVLLLTSVSPANYFRADITLDDGWHFNELPLGPNQVYDADENPNGIWYITGSPNWWDINYISFVFQVPIIEGSGAAVDAVYFYPERWEGTASDATSQTNYGRRDLEVTDDKLHSDSDCQKRAETLLYQLKDSPTQINPMVEGNSNILVGDRLSMTIPAENISAQNYDIIAVENTFMWRGETQPVWDTKTTMVNSVNIRQPVITNQTRVLSELYRHLKELSVEEKRIP